MSANDAKFKAHNAAALDRDVFIVADKDEAGERNAAKAVEWLTKVNARPRIIRLPDLDFSEDLYDWLEAGHTTEEFLEFAWSQPVTNRSGSSTFPSLPRSSGHRR